MKHGKILFAIPKTKSMYGDEESKPLYPHVGIAYLTAILKKKGYLVSIYDQSIDKDLTILYRNIDEFKPDLIGTTGYSYAYSYLEKLIKNIKDYTSTPLIVGGPHVSAVKKKILISTKADFAMTSEADTFFPLFLRQFFKKTPNYEKIPNLIWRKNSTIIQNKTGNYILNLDDLPFPDFYAFKFDLYPCFSEKKIPIITSRGCPYACSYCSVRLSMGQCFRPRSAQNVFEEISYWHSKGFTKFDINDDCFTLDLKRAEKICDLIISHKLKLQLQLYNGIRVDRVNHKLLSKLKMAGCIFIAYGCESGSQKVIDSIGKKIKLAQVRKAVKLSNIVGIKNAVNFIIGHPNETFQDAKKTIKFAKSLETNYVNFYNLVPYPGTPAYHWAIKNSNFLFPKKSYLHTISYRDNTPIFETSEFTASERKQIMEVGFSLYEKKLLQFRLGKNLGLIVFFVTRIKIISSLAHWLLTNNSSFRFLIEKLIEKSKK